jgi:hypothetical protein
MLRRALSIALHSVGKSGCGSTCFWVQRQGSRPRIKPFDRRRCLPLPVQDPSPPPPSPLPPAPGYGLFLVDPMLHWQPIPLSLAARPSATGVPHRPCKYSTTHQTWSAPRGILVLLHLVPITWMLWIPIVPLRSIYHYDGSAAQRRPTPGQNSSTPSPYRSSLHILGIVQRRNPLQHREFLAPMENGWYPEKPLFLEGSLAAQPIHPRCLVGSDRASHKARH